MRLQLFVLFLLLQTATSERPARDRPNLCEFKRNRGFVGVPAEYSDIPSGAVLVSEKLVSPCKDYPFPGPDNRETSCFSEALETTACAVAEAGGVELWVLVSSSTTMDAFLGYASEKHPSDCLRLLAAKDPPMLKIIHNDLGANNAWVRDYAPTLTVDESEDPVDLLLVAHKKFRRSDVSMQQHTDLADQIQSLIETLSSKTAEIQVLAHKPGCSCLDWGNFESDGAGRCLSTHPLCESQIEFLKSHAGCNDIPTDLVAFPEPTKHVDIFARFFAPGKLLMTSYNGSATVQTSGGCSRGTVESAELRAQDNRVDFLELNNDSRITIEDLPTPKSCYKDEDNQRDEALIGYANVLMIKGKGNKKVLLFPTFPRHRDIAPEDVEQSAKAKWKEKLGVETVFDVPADLMFASGGGPHCMTKQYQFRH